MASVHGTNFLIEDHEVLHVQHEDVGAIVLPAGSNELFGMRALVGEGLVVLRCGNLFIVASQLMQLYLFPLFLFDYSPTTTTNWIRAYGPHVDIIPELISYPPTLVSIT